MRTYTFKALVNLKNQHGLKHPQWVTLPAATAYDAKLAFESMYGTILIGPQQVV